MTVINKNAPVSASGEIEVAASPEIIWDIMADIDKWPDWNRDVGWAALSGQFEAGSKFRWKSGPGTIISTIRQVERPRIMAWTGKTLGIYAIHVWKLEPRNGSTAIRTEESWEGLITRIFSGNMQKTLEKAINSGLQYLKAEAERRTKL
ncbi:MAG: SRPBCC family protein [Methanosarcina sp.]|uniref:SRPBCC family protein n=1 Tax=Methanosarcina sp. TaxID=2213 RepID=UPI002632DC70|nr:SRPBCC family protein [Methanosarcina sp.]MDD3246488.1 SRPBCC family protein [Methanosarcina sp.]